MNINNIDITKQINTAKQQYLTDGYSMSIGELMSMYKERELILNPDFQRVFRWTLRQQTKLIESILMGVPLPSIFIYQNEDGNWEVVDGVQRLSTIFQFVGILRDENDELLPPTVLEGTKIFPFFEGMTWSELPLNPLQLDFKRSKVEVKIIKYLSDKNAKFEVFQRLNSGGTNLSAQEFRNCLLVMTNKKVYSWMEELAEDINFRKCINLNERWIQEKYHQELVLRLFVASLYPYRHKSVSEYLDDSIFYNVNDDEKSLLEKIESGEFLLSQEKEKFQRVFSLLAAIPNKECVLNKFGYGQMQESYYEAIAVGLYQNISDYSNTNEDISYISKRILEIEEQDDFNSARRGGRVSGNRIMDLAKFGANYFKK